MPDALDSNVETAVSLHYVYDPTVDEALDAELRGLLSFCFADAVFRRQRFNFELPAHRWLLRAANGTLVAHAAVHDKRVGAPAGEVRVGGVAEVCVHPAWRRQGHVGRLLGAAHAWMRREAVPFAVLVGRTEVYGRLGYVPAANPLRHFRVSERRWVSERLPYLHVLALGPRPWPEGEIDLRGPLF